jgi:hypothetical protein
MKREWQIKRSTVGRDDGQRRWDYAYQFLVRWTLESTPESGPAAPPNQEDCHGDRLVCPSFDQPPTAKSND